MPNIVRTLTRLRDMDDLASAPSSGETGKALLWDNGAGSFVWATPVLADGSVPLTGDWDIGNGRKLSGDTLAARSGSGLRLEDDGGNLGIFIEDGGEVGIGTTSPASQLHLYSTGFSPTLLERVSANSSCQGLAFRKGRGGGSPGVLSGDQLFRFMAFGELDTGGYAAASNNQDVIIAEATENFTATAQGRRTRFITVANGGTSPGLTALTIENNKSIGVNTATVSISGGETGIDLNGSTIRQRSSRTPASAGAAGNTGEFCWDSSYIYQCIATNTWRRVAHATW